MDADVKALLEIIVEEDRPSFLVKGAKAFLDAPETVTKEALIDFLAEVGETITEYRDDGSRLYEIEDYYDGAVQSLYDEEEIKVAQAELSEAVKAFQDALDNAEKIATKYGLGFSMSPAWGMGGYFSAGGWVSSSSGC